MIYVTHFETVAKLNTEDKLNQNTPPATNPFVCSTKAWTDIKKRACALESEIWSLTPDPTLCSYMNLDDGLVFLCPLLTLDFQAPPLDSFRQTHLGGWFLFEFSQW